MASTPDPITEGAKSEAETDKPGMYRWYVLFLLILSRELIKDMENLDVITTGPMPPNPAMR